MTNVVTMELIVTQMLLLRVYSLDLLLTTTTAVGNDEWYRLQVLAVHRAAC